MDEDRLGELLGPFLLGELTIDEERELERHLGVCPGCRRELNSLRQTHDLLRWLAENEPPSDLRALTLERARREGSQAVPEADGGPS